MAEIYPQSARDSLALGRPRAIVGSLILDLKINVPEIRFEPELDECVKMLRYRLDCLDIYENYYFAYANVNPDAPDPQRVGLTPVWCKQVFMLNKHSREWRDYMASKETFGKWIPESTFADSEGLMACRTEHLFLQAYWKGFNRRMEDLFYYAMLHNVENCQLKSTLKSIRNDLVKYENDYYELEGEMEIFLFPLNARLEWLKKLSEKQARIKQLMSQFEHVEGEEPGYLHAMCQPLKDESDFNDATRLHCFGYFLREDMIPIYDAITKLSDEVDTRMRNTEYK